jgi:hypothetical protein
MRKPKLSLSEQAAAISALVDRAHELLDADQTEQSGPRAIAALVAEGADRFTAMHAVFQATREIEA